jgi:NADH dehydrogenase FAD-containing subunit
MVTLERIHEFVAQGIKVTVIAPSDFHYYSGMGPGMLGRTYTPADIRFATQKVVTRQGGVFVRDWVTRIDARAKQVFTKSGNFFEYDVLSFNAGSYVPMDAVEEKGENIFPVKPIEKLMQASEKLEKLFSEGPSRISIVGGGPSSAEIAGNVLQLAKRCGGTEPRVTIFAGNRFMARFAKGVRERVMSTLDKQGIHILETGYVTDVTQNRITLERGEGFETDFTFMASGVIPSRIFKASGLSIGPDNGLLVNEYLQSVDSPDIFGGGDCIHFQPRPLDKVGVYAVRQNPVLCGNLMAQLTGGNLTPFDPGPDYLLIFNLGQGRGVLKKKGLVFGGRPAFWIKDYIDRKFIKRFQSIEK